MQEEWAIVLGASLAVVSGFVLFCIQQIFNWFQKKKNVKASLKFEIDTNWELLTTHGTHGFVPIDTVFQNVLLSGDINYLSKNIKNNYIMVYYRELAYYKAKYKEKWLPGDLLEDNEPMYYRTILNLKDKLRPKKDLRQQKRASKKTRKITNI